MSQFRTKANEKSRERFCQLVASGQSPAESYADAYGLCNMNSARTAAYRLLKIPEVQARIDELRGCVSDIIKTQSVGMLPEKTKEMAALVASATEVLSFLSQTMRDEEQKMSDRLKAAELMGKNQQLFTERINLNEGQLDVNITVVD